ncbi:MAG: HEAT repeat domain-containing protein [Candidatus Sericytochromatia bacterium]
MQKQLPAVEAEALEQLLHCRVDQVRQQQQPSLPAAPYLRPSHSLRGPYSRHQALYELENRLETHRREQGNLQLSLSQRLNCLHDLNLELLESLAQQTPAQQRAERWEAAIKWVVELFWQAPEPSSARDPLFERLSQEDPAELAAWALRHSPAITSQCAALRLQAQSLMPDELEQAWLPLLTYPATPVPVLLEILQRLPQPAGFRLYNSLLELVMQSRSDHPPDSFASVRQKALHMLAYAPAQPTGPLLQQGVRAHRQDWQLRTTLQALQTLARLGYTEGFEWALEALQEAARQDDPPILQLAAETLGLQGDPRAVPYLLGVLNGQYRQLTALEQFRSAFAAEIQEQQPVIQQALERLGCPVQQDPISGRWQGQLS